MAGAAWGANSCLVFKVKCRECMHGIRALEATVLLRVRSGPLWDPFLRPLLTTNEFTC